MPKAIRTAGELRLALRSRERSPCCRCYARVQQAAKPATLEDALVQIEALKKQMSDLEKFVKDQVQQRSASLPAPTPPPTASSPPSDKSLETGFVKGNELTVGKSKFKLYGFLRLDAIYDDSRSNNTQADNEKLVRLTTGDGYTGPDKANIDERRVTWSRGRDLTLSPHQDAGPVNALAKAYVEVDGKPATEKEVWTRKLTFREIKP